MVGVRERGNFMMSTEEGTWVEHWCCMLSDESWESSPEAQSTLFTLYVS